MSQHHAHSYGKNRCCCNYYCLKKLRFKVFIPISHIINIVFGTLNIFNLLNVIDMDDSFILRFLLAIACLFSWVILVFSVRSKGTPFLTLYKTMQLSSYPLLQLIISVFPLYCGYMYAGTLLFTPQQNDTLFGNPDMSAKTLFSIMLGDLINDGFQRAGVGIWYAELYMYTFIFLFKLCIYYLALIIVETVFFQTLPPLAPHSFVCLCVSLSLSFCFGVCVFLK